MIFVYRIYIYKYVYIYIYTHIYTYVIPVPFLNGLGSGVAPHRTREPEDLL